MIALVINENVIKHLFPLTADKLSACTQGCSFIILKSIDQFDIVLVNINCFVTDILVNLQTF